MLAPVFELRPRPAGRFVHPKARDLVDNEGEHDIGLENSADNATGYLGWLAELCDRHLGHRVLEVGAGYGLITSGYEAGREVVASDASPVAVAGSARALRGPSQRDGRRRRPAHLPARRALRLGADGQRARAHPRRRRGAARAERAARRRSATSSSTSRRSTACTASGTTWAATTDATRVGGCARCSRPRAWSRSSCATSTRWRSCPTSCSRASGDVTDEGRRGRLLKIWDAVGVPLNRMIDAHLRPPVGLNLFGVARRRD